MKSTAKKVANIDDHLAARVRAVKVEDIAARVAQQMGESSISAIYKDRVRSQRTRQYELRATTKTVPVSVLHTLLGIEIKIGNRRLLCPDLATARYLSVFARLGCDLITVPYDITQVSSVADELESSWHRMMLLIDHLTEGRSRKLRAMVERRLINETRSAIADTGAGSKFPDFNQPRRRSPKK